MSTCFHGFQFSRTWCSTQEMGLYKSDTMEYFASSSVLQHAICFVFQTKLVHELVGAVVFPWRRQKSLNESLHNVVTVHMPNNGGSSEYITASPFSWNHIDSHEKWCYGGKVHHTASKKTKKQWIVMPSLFQHSHNNSHCNRMVGRGHLEPDGEQMRALLFTLTTFVTLLRSCDSSLPLFLHRSRMIMPGFI